MGRIMKVLVVDDDEKLQKLLKEYLTGYGYSVISLFEGKSTLEAIREQSPHIVILDIMLPDEDGLQVLTAIRRQYSIPVLMLTARGDETDRIVGLELGADDYLPKPFNPRELLARMKAIMRRQTSQKEANGNEKNIVRGDLILNRARQTLSKEKRAVELSTTEFRLMETLMEAPNIVLSRDQLMQAARGRDTVAFDRSIDVHISKLRAKLEEIADSPERIKTVWGTGYMLLCE
jgi:two-component system phosphate regulon response regulator OmpR